MKSLRNLLKALKMLDRLIMLSICLIIVMPINVVYSRPLNELIKTRETPETQIPAELSDSNSGSLRPNEVQKAVCTVTSGDVRASAEAFTTRELKGVCGSTEMSNAFSDLENKLRQELQNLQSLVQDIHRQLVSRNSVQPSFNKSSEEPVTSSGSSYVVTPATFKFQPIPTNNKQQKAIELNTNYYLTPKLKSLSTRDEANGTTLRENEVTKYNNTRTFITNKDVKVYTYYWRMENFTDSIKSAKSFTMESPIFSIRDKALKMKAHFQHLHRDYFYLQLEDYSSTPELSLGNSIILDTGGIFKEISSDNLKYKISILDQNKKRSSDLVSQEFDNYETGFSIPNSALIDSPFIKDNSLFIQLFLYL